MTPTPARRAEIRYLHGELDEIVVDTTVLVHLERMDEGRVWHVGVFLENGRAILVTLSSKEAIEVEAQPDNPDDVQIVMK